MNIIKDKSRTLNLSPTNIYFLVRENEIPKIISFAEEFNNSPSLNRGIFKIFPLEAENQESRSIQNLIGSDNVVVRLIENLGDDHQYLIDQINLNQNNELVLRDLKKFLLMASRQDIANIHKRINSYSPENPEEDDRIELFGNFISILQKAIDKYEEQSQGNYDSNALGKTMPGLLDDIIAEYPSFVTDMAQVMRQNLNTKKKVKDKALARICEVIQDILGVSDFENLKSFKGEEQPEEKYSSNIPKELFIVLPTKVNEKLSKQDRVIEFPIYLRNKKLDSIKFTSPDRGVLYALIIASFALSIASRT